MSGQGKGLSHHAPLEVSHLPEHFDAIRLTTSATKGVLEPGCSLMSADFSAADLAAIEAETQSIGRHLFANLDDTRPRIWNRRWWDDRMMAWSMQDESLKVQLFRFVDVLPMLGSADS